MDKDLVIGLDVSTSATKAIAWTRDGVALAEGRSVIAMSRPSADACEQDPEEWWRSACAALRELLGQVDPARIAALAISNQRETFVPLAADGSASAHGPTWAGSAAASVRAASTRFPGSRLTWRRSPTVWPGCSTRNPKP